MRPSICVLVLLPGLALAQGQRDGDRLLDAGELSDRLSGQAISFFDGSTARYHADGAYTYNYTPDDPAFIGRYSAGDGGQVCVTFDNGFDRCDTYVEAGGRLVLITADGLRFPVRTVEPLSP